MDLLLGSGPRSIPPVERIDHGSSPALEQNGRCGVTGDDRLMRIAVAFARSTTKPRARLCTACTEVLQVSGAGISVMAGDQPGPLCVSSERMRIVEDLQFTTGEGPCQDAFSSARPVSAARLDVDASRRWPGFVDLAVVNGIGAVFAYPMMASGITVGALTLYQDEPGALTAEQHEDSLALADVLTETVLSLQDAAPEGVLAAELDDVVAYRAQIHQASGMASVQLGVSPLDALSAIRAYAFAHDLAVDTVAADIVSRRLRLTNDHDPASEGE
jgi:hypothetical protein